jgi:deoxyribose-phosphate aldolase
MDHARLGGTLRPAFSVRLRGGYRLRRQRHRSRQSAPRRPGADFVKSSTGFHPAGGATVEAIEIMSGAVGGRLGVKAAGGIHDAETAFAMVDAGATRLGLSASAAILGEFGQTLRPR